MNIEDKYKSFCHNEKLIPEPKLWEEISDRLDKKSNSSNYWMIAAASIVLGLFFYSYEFEKLEPQKMVQQIKLQKLTPTTITDKNAEQFAYSMNKVKTIIEPEKRSESVFILPVKTIHKIANENIPTGIKHTKIVFVRLKIKAKPKRKLKLKHFKNPVKKVISLTKLALKRTRNKIEIPIIEIDYKSLLTLNN